MKLKPTIRLSSRRSRLAALAAAATTVVSIAGLAVTTPAHADPTVVYNTVGSDTIQDVMNTFSTDIGSNQLGSWNAVNPVTANPHEIISYTDGHSGTQCSFTRPNGSTEGKNAFRKSINQNTTATQLAAAPQAGCIDFSRSSSGPGADASTTGSLVFIPFALDAVDGATGPATGTGATVLTHANLFTLADLKTLYATGGTVTEGGVTYNPQTATAGQTQINLYLPQAGSGTLAFWSSTLGIPSPLPTWDHQTIVAGPNSGTQVEEHNGLATTDPNGYMPFSIAQWIAQSNGIDDRRHGAVLQNINGIFPCSGNSNCSPNNGTLNTAFPITREVYNVAQYDHVVNTGDGNFDPGLAAMLAGTNSALCQDPFTITGDGFAQLSTPATTDNCGSTANSLRAFDPTTDPV